MRTTNGSVSAVKMLVSESSVVYKTLSNPSYGKEIDINEFQKMLGCLPDVELNSMRIIQTRYVVWLGKATMIGVRIKLLHMIMIKIKTSEIPRKNM
jgi:hypothetical protein